MVRPSFPEPEHVHEGDGRSVGHHAGGVKPDGIVQDQEAGGPSSK